ncbi:hypothetical protein MG293_000773 [Ovis ammon polii]|uniref:Uncharacterized protein n=1 Tax=Ovis ammon polii TaxID=230172 RepID=A0AAD4YHL7_OVIAM|nr:hypothetical protein MG293_000773 [Ovis ammon polii]
MFKVGRGGSEETSLVQGKEQPLHFAGAAMKRYRTSKTIYIASLTIPKTQELELRSEVGFQENPAAAASVSVGAPARAWYKNSLAFASDIGSLVVIGRFRDLGITFGGSSWISHRLHGKTDPESHLQPQDYSENFVIMFGMEWRRIEKPLVLQMTTKNLDQLLFTHHFVTPVKLLAFPLLEC